MIAQTHPNISGCFTVIDDAIFAKIGVRSLDLKDWVDSGHFKRGHFETKCLLTYKSGTQLTEGSFMDENGTLMQTTWEIQFPIMAGSNTYPQTIQNIIGGMIDVVAELAKGELVNSDVVGCDQLESLENDFELQEPLDERLMQNWGILTFPQVSVYSEGVFS